MILKRLLAMVTMVAAVTVMLPSGQAAAAPSPDGSTHGGPVGRSPEAALDALLAANPGAKRISKDTVKLANGVEASVSSAAVPCPSRHLCIYDQYNYYGYWTKFYYCGFVNIGHLGWSDRIRSYQNLQSGGAVSIFMDWCDGRWVEVERSRATEIIPVERGARWADGIWVC